MKEDAHRMILLFDYYGEALTPRQRECFDQHYNDDLSLAEIAEHLGISRQGVRDNIVRAEKALLDMEEKSGLLARRTENQKTAQRLLEIAAELNEIARSMKE
jgi:predicted DNA-binding protein YlxM (UPF0122 family)